MADLSETQAPRHPEKAHKPDNPVRRKPAWIRVKAPTSREYHETRKLMRDLLRMRGQALAIAPDMTVSGVARLFHADTPGIRRFLDGLRLAGLPEDTE